MECYKAIVDPEGYSAPIKTINNSNPQGQNGVNVGSTDPISREEA
jgi:hypothetical protein